jgi:hypothetical protein
MIVIKCQDHYDLVLEYAKSIGKEKEFLAKVSELNKLGDSVELYKDFAPYSFDFSSFKDGKRYICGGLLYHGKPDESLSVSLNPIHGWSIHT